MGSTQYIRNRICKVENKSNNANNSSRSILTANVYTSRSTFGDRFIRLVPRPGENECTDRVNNNMNDAHDAYRSWLNFFMVRFGCMQALFSAKSNDRIIRILEATI